MDAVKVKLLSRTVIGKKVKNLRHKGIVPVHVYGNGVEPMSLQTDAQVLRRLLPQVGTNIPLSVEIEGNKGENICFVREVQRHPVTEDVLHVDFLRVDVAQTIQAEVPIVFVGEAPAARQMGGTLLQSLQNVLVEGLPMNIPPLVEIDVSGLDDFEKSIYISDLEIAADVTLITNPEELIARVSPPRVEVEEVVEEEELEEGEEAAEGEEAEAGAAEGSAEQR